MKWIGWSTKAYRIINLLVYNVQDLSYLIQWYKPQAQVVLKQHSPSWKINCQEEPLLKKIKEKFWQAFVAMLMEFAYGVELQNRAGRFFNFGKWWQNKTFNNSQRAWTSGRSMVHLLWNLNICSPSRGNRNSIESVWKNIALIHGLCFKSSHGYPTCPSILLCCRTSGRNKCWLLPAFWSLKSLKLLLLARLFTQEGKKDAQFCQLSYSILGNQKQEREDASWSMCWKTMNIFCLDT